MEHFHVEPIHVMDAHSGLAHSLVAIGYTFSGAIDRSRIESAVQKQVQKWPRLGVRLRRSNSNPEVLEALIPDAQHAVLTTTFYTTCKGIREVQTLPARTPAITTQTLFRNPILYYDKSEPALAELISSESPAFRLHVSCLTDATIFTFTFPHVLMGGSGLDLVVRGLLSALEERELLDELEGDPWSNLINSARSGANSTVRGWKTCGPSDFVGATDTERTDFEQDGPFSQRTVYFPLTEVERLKNQAMVELKTLGLDVPFLSSGDIIVAWMYKHFYGGEQSDPEQTGRLLLLMDAKKRLPRSFPSHKVYLKNSIIFNAANKHANRQIRNMTLGEIARLIRELVTEGSKEEIVLDHLKWKYDHAGQIQIPYPAEERVLLVSNLLMFNWGDLSVSRVVKPGTGTGELMDVYWSTPGLPRGGGYITMQDHDGGIHAGFNWPEANWKSGSLAKYSIQNTTRCKL